MTEGGYILEPSKHGTYGAYTVVGNVDSRIYKSHVLTGDGVKTIVVRESRITVNVKIVSKDISTLFHSQCPIGGVMKV